MSVLDSERLPFDVAGRPLLAAAVEAWRAWAGEAAAPSWADVVLPELPAKLLPTTVVVDVVDGIGGGDYRYRFWGTGMRDLFGTDETGNLLSETLLSPFREVTFEQLDLVRETGEPVFYRIDLRQPNGIAAVKWNVRLPVMDRPGEVTKIITVSDVEPLKLRLGDDLSEIWKNPTGDG